MPQFTIPLEGGGEMHVNASDLNAAVANVQSTGNVPAGQSSSSSSGGGSSQPSTPSPSNGGLPNVTPRASEQVFNTSNGLRTPSQMQAELLKAGWDSVGDIPTVYARTTGQTVSPTGQNVSAGHPVATAGIGPGSVVQPAANVAPGNTNNQNVPPWLQDLLQSLASGNKAAFDESVRQFNQTFGLDTNKFNESVRQYNQSFGLSEAAVTGTYNGQPTLASKQLGLDAIKTASELQADPFRQAEALYGLAQGGYSPLMQAVKGLAPLPAFQAPTLSAADTRSLDFLSRQGMPGSYNTNQSTMWLNGLPSPNQVDWNAVNRATPGAQNLVVKGLSYKWGLPEADIMAIGKATLPAFTSPSLTGSVTG